uniref:Peptidase S1 domain-containing protein n=1 Tax=Anopheles dirus TaxID=7168 RepID=A0A182MXU4_9DIPT
MWKVTCVALLALSYGTFVLAGSAESNDSKEDSSSPEAPPSGVKTSGRIINGKDTTISKHPFTVRVQVNKAGYCGGSVITYHHVLTAAHCLEEGFTAKQVTVYGNTTYESRGGVVFKVKKIDMHPNYNITMLANDVAILTIKGTFKGYTNIAIIPLQTEELEVTSTPTWCYFVGWGYTNYKEAKFSEILQYADVRLMEYKKCKRNFEILKPDMICVKPKKGEDVCDSDSGGPLVCGGKLTGVVSFGSDECTADAPVVFAKVVHPNIPLSYGTFVLAGSAESHDSKEDSNVPEAPPSGVKTSGRIVNGKDTTISKHPFTVRVQVDGGGYCGGSVITYHHVLTAAHCFDEGFTANQLTVKGNSTYESSGGVVFKVKRLDMHPKYNVTYLANDVAILTIKGSFKGYANIAKIPLQDKELHVTSTPTWCYFVGWGYTNYKEAKFSEILQYADVRLMDYNECKKDDPSLRRHMICAMPKKGKDVCNSDSGGPLVCDGKLTGVVSYGSAECTADAPVVFAKVVHPNIRSAESHDSKEDSNAPEAGPSDVEVSGRVINGKDTTIKKHPYAVRIYAAGQGGICGGSVITDKHVLTAAHCFDDGETAKDLTVRVGSTSQSHGGHVFSIKKIAKHPKYDKTVFDYDAAVLTINGSFTGLKNVAVVALQDEVVDVGVLCEGVGWGYIDRKKKINPDTLQYLQLSMLDEDDCADDSVVCAQSPKGSDLCQGDSGGPFVCNNKLTGVTSSGDPRCVGTYKANFAKVRHPPIRAFIPLSYGTFVLAGSAESHDSKEDSNTPEAPHSAVKSSGRVINGKNTTIKKHPYVARIYMTGKGGICGGSVITDKHIVTAAHCIRKGETYKDIYVRVGSTSQSTGGYLFNLTSLALHPKWDPDTVDFDVALLTIDGSFAGLQDVEKIALQDEVVPAGVACDGVGWGYNNRKKTKNPDTLQYLQLHILDEQECEDDRIICAQSPKGSDLCEGDSGGPFVCHKKLTGITSFGDEKCIGSVKASFAKIRHPLYHYVCGGSIITDKHIVTAAYCIRKGETYKNIYVRVGSTGQSTGGYSFNLTSLALHPKWDPDTVDFDVALLTIDGSFAGLQDVEKIALQDEVVPAGVACDGVGWGYNNRKKTKNPDTLQYLQLHILDEQECEDDSGKVLAKTGASFNITDFLSGSKGFPKTLPWEAQNVSHSGRIINGKTIGIEYIPSMLHLRVNNQGRQSVCGASVISYWHALTAAHCVNDVRYNPAGVTMYGGSTSRSSGGIVFQANNIFVHPKYNPSNLDYDAAVIRVSKSFYGQNNVAPVQLQDTAIPSSAWCLTFGWGVNNYQTGNLPDYLQYEWFQVIAPEQCSAIYGYLSPRVICVKRGSSIDICGGDSGGPLICNGKLTGITSFNTDKCSGNYPAGFAKVIDPEIRQFIRDYAQVLMLFCTGVSGTEDARSGRIIGGRNADIQDHPYMLLMRKNGYASCGAAVIGPKYALTAAHCVYPMPNLTTVMSMLGFCSIQISLHGGSSTQNGAAVIFKVQRIVIHPNYTDSTIDNDVAIIEVTSLFTGHPNVASIELQKSEPIISATSPTVCNITGWGIVNKGTNALSNTLQVASMRLLVPRTCRLQWYPRLVTASMICARGDSTDACAGDSGSPLVCEGRLYGVVSWGTSRCDATKPAVFANVPASRIRAFISSITGI